MRKLLTGILALVLVFGLASVDTAQAALKGEYKLTMNVTTDTAWGQGGVKFAELVKDYTGGKVNVKVYPSAQLVGGDLWAVATSDLDLANHEVEFPPMIGNSAIQLTARLEAVESQTSP